MPLAGQDDNIDTGGALKLVRLDADALVVLAGQVEQKVKLARKDLPQRALAGAAGADDQNPRLLLVSLALALPPISDSGNRHRDAGPVLPYSPGDGPDGSRLRAARLRAGAGHRGRSFLAIAGLPGLLSWAGIWPLHQFTAKHAANLLRSGQRQSALTLRELAEPVQPCAALLTELVQTAAAAADRLAQLLHQPYATLVAWIITAIVNYQYLTPTLLEGPVRPWRARIWARAPIA